MSRILFLFPGYKKTRPGKAGSGVVSVDRAAMEGEPERRSVLSDMRDSLDESSLMIGDGDDDIGRAADEWPFC